MNRGRPPTSLLLVAAVVAVLGAACGDEQQAAGAPVVSASPPRPAARPPIVAPSPTRGIERVEPELVDALDAAFIDRVDLFALAVPRRPLTLWLWDRDLVAARLVLPSGGGITAALYEGALALHGFYDADGRSSASASMRSPVPHPFTVASTTAFLSTRPCSPPVADE